MEIEAKYRFALVDGVEEQVKGVFYPGSSNKDVDAVLLQASNYCLSCSISTATCAQA